MGAGATAERRVAVLSLALDKSSQSRRPASFSWAGCPSLPTRLAGPGSIPAPSEQWRQVRIATSVIIRLVINYVVAVIWGNPFSRQSGVVCSRVLDLLQPRRPLSVLTPSLDPGSREPTQAESDIVVCAFSQGAHWHATVVYPSNLNSAASTAIRQQFLFSLLEERRFFAHLVLRYVRAARNSASPPEARKSLPAESSSQPVSPKTRSISNLLAQQFGQNPSVLESEPASLQTFWADIACRVVQATRSPGAIS